MNSVFSYSVLLVPLIGLIITGALVAIGVYVYRDARNRGLNAVLWTLIAVLAPSLVGFIIYLLIRGSHPNMNCPNCDTKINDQYVVCPKCGTALKPSCPSCKTPVEPDWKLCPKCTEKLPEEYDYTPPKRPRDHIGKILILIIVTPIVILTLALILLAFAKKEGGGLAMAGAIPIENIADCSNSDYIYDWYYTNLDKNTHNAYVLYHRTNNENDEYVYTYLVHIPEASIDAQFGMDVKHGNMFEDIYILEYETLEQTENPGGCLFFSTTTSDKKLDLELLLNGENIDFEISRVDFIPAEELIDYME